MDPKEKYYPESRFGGFTDIDGTMVFYYRVNALLQPSFTVLDIGCGRGEYVSDPVPLRRDLRVLRGKVAKVLGLDVDQNAQSNPFVDECRIMKGTAWPVESNAVDLILCDQVLEHIEDIPSFFSETHRVLKNKGFICIRTPNRWGYIACISRLVPNRFHSKFIARIGGKRKQEDIFPVHYHCNSIPKIKTMFKKINLDGVVYGYNPEPSYLSFSTIFYALGVVHQKMSPGFLKTILFAFGQIQK
jgi:SAM-dependent methyltransferase